MQRLQAALGKIEELEAQATLKPIERADDTYMFINLSGHKQRLLDELARYQRVVEQEKLKTAAA